MNQNNVHLVLGFRPTLARNQSCRALLSTALKVMFFTGKRIIPKHLRHKENAKYMQSKARHSSPQSPSIIRRLLRACFSDLCSIMTQGGEQRAAKTKIKSLAKRLAWLPRKERKWGVMRDPGSVQSGSTLLCSARWL